ncbi:MAG: hypothetical protein U5J97_08290 [Trueperaceae bacterium]|nr:hypothetical protein [Trueperaceae bacterium]
MQDDPVFWDVVLEARAPGQWSLRGDAGVRRPLARAFGHVRVPAGSGHRAQVLPTGADGGPVTDVPTLAPEIVLLTKARLADRRPRAEDDDDLRRVAATLAPEARAWLLAALERAPRHRWADLLVSRRPGPSAPP